MSPRRPTVTAIAYAPRAAKAMRMLDRLDVSDMPSPPFANEGMLTPLGGAAQIHRYWSGTGT